MSQTELPKIKAEIDNHNSGIKREYGGRGICTVSLQRRNDDDATLSLRFSYPVNRQGMQNSKQYSLGVGSALSQGCRNKAYQASRIITHALKNSRFAHNPITFWDYLDYDVLGVSQPGNQSHIIGDLINAFKDHWIKSNGDNPDAEKRYQGLRGYQLNQLPYNAELSSNTLNDFVKSLPDNTYSKQIITAVRDLLGYHQLLDNYKSILDARSFTGKDAKKNSKYTPNDQQILKVFKFGFPLTRKDGEQKRPKDLHATRCYQWTFGIMAVYGIRAHELFHVMNWHDSVDISGDEWVTVDSEKNSTDEEYGESQEQLGEDYTIPAFFDPSNPFPMLVISNETKTGKRLAIPLSPPGENWIEQFHLKDELLLPQITDPTSLGSNGRSKGIYGITKYFNNQTPGGIRWDLVGVPSFTSHKLRHAYTHRGRSIGFDAWKLAQAQGHTLSTAENVYAKHFHGQRTKAMLIDEMRRIQGQSTKSLTLEQAIARAPAVATATGISLDDLMTVINELFNI